MKKIILIALMFFSLDGYSQKFSVTPEGLKDSLNIDKSYIVINIEGKTAKDLYESIIKYINVTYKNPKEVLKGNVENEFISFETYVANFPLTKNGYAKMNIGTKYTTTLGFKDGKIKYEISDIKMKAVDSQYEVLFSGGAFSGYPIYNKSGELKRKETKEDIEKYFNNNIKNIFDYVSGKSKTNEGW
jgi:hypothetical protein